MNLEKYLKIKSDLSKAKKKPRENCYLCRQPTIACFCAEVVPFDPKIQFVILTHPVEARKRMATGWLSHRCCKGSKVIVGREFTKNAIVARIIGDERNDCVVLYPGMGAKNLNRMTISEKNRLGHRDKKLVVFVMDGTWTNAGKMLSRSENLVKLPRIFFVPTFESKFKVRRQPKSGCLSTVEAIHNTIEILGESQGYDLNSRRHDNLLDVFEYLVEQQVFLTEVHSNLKYMNGLWERAPVTNDHFEISTPQILPKFADRL